MGKSKPGRAAHTENSLFKKSHVHSDKKKARYESFDLDDELLYWEELDDDEEDIGTATLTPDMDD